MAQIEDQTITIAGTVGGPPELRFTPSGAAVCNFSMAVNHRRFDRQANQWVEDGTDWHRVTCWRQMAENVAESFNKGDRVIVWGRFKSRQFETREGQRITVWEVTADEIGHSCKFGTTTQKRPDRSGQQQSSGQRNQGGQYQQSSNEDPWGSGPEDQRNYGGGQQGQRTEDPWGAPPNSAGFADEPPF
jgi:single-strand DNA-binding protein